MIIKMSSCFNKSKLSFRILLLFFLVGSGFHSIAQKIDLLEDSLKSYSLTDEQKIDIHNTLAKEYSFVDAVKLLYTCRMALKLSQDLNAILSNGECIQE